MIFSGDRKPEGSRKAREAELATARRTGVSPLPFCADPDYFCSRSFEAEAYV